MRIHGVVYQHGYPLGPSRGIVQDAMAGEADDCPPFTRRGFVERCVIPLGLWRGVPVVAIGLNNQTSILKDEVRLPSAEHGSMHLEGQTEANKSILESSLNVCHLLGEPLAHSVGTDFWGGLEASNQFCPINGVFPLGGSATPVTTERASVRARLRLLALDLCTATGASEHDSVSLPASGEVTSPRTILAAALATIPRRIFRIASLASTQFIHLTKIILLVILKPIYWRCGVQNLRRIEREMATPDLLSLIEASTG